MQLSRTKVNRLYLLQGGQVVRLQTNQGFTVDVLVSSISQVQYNGQNHFLHISAGSNETSGTQVFYLELSQSQMINLPILFAITRHQVSAIV